MAQKAYFDDNIHIVNTKRYKKHKPKLLGEHKTGGHFVLQNGCHFYVFLYIFSDNIGVMCLINIIIVIIRLSLIMSCCYKCIFDLLRVNGSYLYLSCHSKWPPLSPFQHIFSYNSCGECQINFILQILHLSR